MNKLSNQKSGFGLLPLIWGGVGLATVIVATGLGGTELINALPQQVMQSIETGEWANLNASRFELRRSEDFWQTEVKLKEKAQQEPNNPIPPYLLGVLYQALGHPRTAIDDYNLSVRLSEDSWANQALYQSLANNSHAELALLYYQAGQAKEALKHLNQVSNMETVPHVELISALKEVLMNTKRADAHLKLGIQWRKHLQILSALQEFKLASRLARDPQTKQAAHLWLEHKLPLSHKELPALAVYYSLAGDYQSEQKHKPEVAIEMYERAIHEANSFEWAYHHLGLLYHAMNENDDAERYAKTALRINPNFALPYLTLGDIALDDESFEEAVFNYAHAQRLLKTSELPEDNSLFSNIENMIGFAEEHLGNKQQAKKHYSQVLSISSTSSPDYQYAEEALKRLEQSS